MTLSSALPHPAPASTAWAAARDRLRRRWSRTVGFVAVLCVGIAMLLTAMDGGGFRFKLVYSLSIGAASLGVTDGTRLLVAWLTDRVRAARGLPPSASGFGNGWGGLLPAAVLAVVIGPVAGQWLGDRITGFHSPSLLQMDAGNSRLTLALSVLGTLVSVIMLSTLERLSSARAQAEAAQRLAAESQLALLQSQLEPHMLFNTLANLRVLIGIDAQRAQAMLDRLIAFLRSTLQATRTQAHPLAAEFEHLADYLSLMSLRMGPRLAVHFDLPEALRSLAVPPLLLQPLVENAIKHGLEPKVEGGRLEVVAGRQGQVLQLSVRDTGVGLAVGAATAGSAFGLTQVRARLAALYGDAAGLRLEPADDGHGGVLARVWLPVAAGSAAAPPAPVSACVAAPAPQRKNG